MAAQRDFGAAPVQPIWSDALGAAMQRSGRALAEEAVASALLDDLIRS